MSDNDPVVEAKKSIKRIRRAGLSAWLLGYFLVLLSIGLVWFLTSKSLILLGFVVLVLVGPFFVWSGAYVKDGWGRRTKLLLLINGILALPFCILIIPVFSCVQSFKNHTRFKELPEKIKEIYSKPKPFKIHWLSLISVVMLVLVSVGSLSYRLYKLNKAEVAAAKSAQTSTGPVVVNEPKYKFAIQFPEQPSASDFTTQKSGYTVPYTTYVSHAANGSQDFDVYAYSWPSQNFDFSKLAPADMAKQISNSVDDIIKERKGTVINRSSSTFQGYPSEDAQFSSPTLSGTPVNGYIRVFYVNNYEYAIFTLAANQSDFANFANTFQYKP